MHATGTEKKHLCVFGEMRDEYLPDHVRYLNDPEVNRFLIPRPPFTIEGQREWFQKRREAGDIIHAILVLDSGVAELSIFAGVEHLHSIDREARTAWTGMVIGNKRYWGKGIARQARLVHLQIAFEELGLEWVYSTAAAPNQRSRRFMESIGYELFKVERNTRMVEGKVCDEIQYRISRSLWLPYREISAGNVA